MLITEIAAEDQEALDAIYDSLIEKNETTAANSNEYLVGIVQGILDNYKKHNIKQRTETIFTKILEAKQEDKVKYALELEKFEAAVAAIEVKGVDVGEVIEVKE